MLLIFPLFMGLSGYIDLTRSKQYFFVLSTAAWGCGLLFCLVLYLSRGEKSEESFKPRAHLCSFAVIAFLIFSCVSALASPYGFKTSFFGAGRYDGLLNLLLYGAVFLGVSHFGRLGGYHIAALGISAAVCCAVAILQLLNLNPFWLYPEGSTYHSLRILSSIEFLGAIGNADLLSAFLCLGVPFFACLTVRRGGIYWLLLPPAALGVFVLAASKVSGGAVALAAVCVLCAPAIVRNISGLRRYLYTLSAFGASAALALSCRWPDGSEIFSLSLGREAAALLILSAALCALAPLTLLNRINLLTVKRSAVFIICAAIILLAFAAVFFYPGESGTLREISSAMHGELNDSFGSSRIRIWRDVLALVPERPILGAGPGTISLRLDIVFSRPDTTRTTSVDNAHNEYLGLLADVGILGLLAFLAAIIISLVGFYKRADGNAAALGAGVICYWFQSFFGLGICVVAPLMWLMWGLFRAENSTAKLNDKE
jgi:O-antigen ligase